MRTEVINLSSELMRTLGFSLMIQGRWICGIGIGMGLGLGMGLG